MSKRVEILSWNGHRIVYMLGRLGTGLLMINYECQWFLGFLRQFQAETDLNVRENMFRNWVRYRALTGCCRFWVAHFVLVHRLADGLASWQDLDSVNRVRERYSHIPSEPNKRKSERDNAAGKVWREVACFKYNKNQCTESFLAFVPKV